MIKSTELRLGSLIYNTKGEVDVVSVEAIKYIKDYDGIHQATPIPLTEEWLIRMGFDQHRLRDNQFNKGRYLIEKSFHDGLWNFRVKDTTESSIYVRHVQFVHEVQNINHAFYGEDLTIQPKTEG